MSPPIRTGPESAYLLHRRSYRETSLLLEVLTRERGRVALLGRGIRRQKSQQTALMWPFIPLVISWAGRGELPVLTQVEREATGGIGITSNLSCALYLNELIMLLLPVGDPHPGVFDLYRSVLQELASEAEPAPTLRLFELGLLDEIGYGLVLDRDVVGDVPIDPERHYDYRLEAGPVAVEPSPEAYRGSTLLALKHRKVDVATARGEAKRLMRRVISHHLGGRALRSRELFRFASPP